MGTVLGQLAAVDRQTWSWAMAMLGRRKHVALQHRSQATDLWTYVLASLRKRRNIVLGDGGQRSKQVMQQAYVVYTHSMRFACDALDRSRALYAHGLQYASPLQIVIGLTIASLMLLMTLVFFVRSVSSAHRIPQLLNEKKQTVEDEFDSDEFEFEEDSAEEETTSSGDGMTRKIRRALLPPHSHRRTGSRDSTTMGRRPSSIIRITSSDPRSQLSINAMQMDLDSSGMVRTGSNLGSSVRRRKESGRLLAGMNQDSSSSAPAPASLIPTPSARIIHTAARAAKQRRPSPRAPDHDRRPPRPEGPSKLRTSVGSDEDSLRTPSSPNSITSFSSALTGVDDPDWHPIDSPSSNSLASILRREPQRYASLPGPMFSGNGAPREFGDDLAPSWGNGAPVTVTSEILPGDQHNATSIPPSPSASKRLPPGAGYAQNVPLGQSSPVPRLGTLSPEQARALWPEKRTRKVKLKEPDWRPYTDLHERARERMQKFSELTGARSASPMLLASGSSASDEESRNGTPTGDSADGRETDEDFWYERFTRSTAASGRDWDWRKRRARQAAALRSAAALEAIGGPDVGHFNASSGSPGPALPPKLHESGYAGLLPSHAPPGLPLRSTSQGTSHRSIPPLVSNSDDAHTPTTPTNGSIHPPTSDYGSGGKRSRRYSDTDQNDANAAMSGVPGRLSSLKPKGVKKIMSNRRGSNASSATLTSALASPGETSRGLEMTPKTTSRLEQEFPSPRRSASVTQLDRAYARGATDLTTVRRPSPLSAPPSGWTEEYVHSSADAYGAATALQHPVLQSNSVTGSLLFSDPPISPRTPNPPLSMQSTASPRAATVPNLPPPIPRRRDTEPLRDLLSAGPPRLVIPPVREIVRDPPGRQSPSSRRDILLSAAQRSM